MSDAPSSGTVTTSTSHTPALPTRRGWFARLGIAFVRVTLFLVLLLLCGIVMQWLMTAFDRYRYPPPGRLVDVGGYQLHLSCRGTGHPTVIMDAGLGDSLLMWATIQPALAPTTRVCTYDRAGLGWSERGAQPRTLAAMSEELHVLLQHAQIPGPYILVGHSFGGYIAQFYALHYPEAVAGLVLVDSSLEDLSLHAPAYQALSAPPDIVYTVGQGIVFTGIGRLAAPLIPMDSDKLPASVQAEAQALEQQVSVIRASVEEAKQRPQIEAEMRLARRPFGNLPLIVLVHDPAYALPEGLPADMQAAFQQTEPVVQMLQAALARQSTQGQLIVVQGAGHYIQLDTPEVVIAAIHDVIERTRRPAH